MSATAFSLLVLTTLLTLITSSILDWKTVDNSGHPYSNDDILVIKINSVLGSDDQVAIIFEPISAGAPTRQIYLYFNSPTMKYSINACIGYHTVIDSPVPAAQDKVWTIRKNNARIEITCNDEEIIVLDYVDGLSLCSESWSKSEEAVRFLTTDTASDQFRVLPGGSAYTTPSIFTVG